MNITLLMPEIAVVTLAVLLIILDLLLPHQDTRRSLGYLATAGILGILAYTSTQYGVTVTVYQGIFVIDNFALFFKQIFLVSMLLILLFSFDYVESLSWYRGEFYSLLLFALTGMMVMASANDLITLFVGMELMTISFYILVGFHFKDNKSSEAGMKYLIISSASSAVLLYGMSWIYGYTGSIKLLDIISHADASPAMLLGLGLMLAGFCFKLAIVPFHMWSPDIYEGAPTPVTALLTMGSMVASFAVLLRIFLVAFYDLQGYWLPIVSILAATSMIAGNVMAMWQTNIKRMLAYSSIAQAGYMLSGLLAVDVAGVKGILFYAMLYIFANVGAFAVIIAVSRHTGSEDIKKFAGLSQKSPFLALVMVVALLSMAGIPPLAGFVGKLYLFMAVAEKGYLWIVIIGFVMSMISVYYYLLVVKAMYMEEPQDQQKFIISKPLWLAAMVSLIATLCIGIYPAPLAELTNIAARSLW